MFTPNSEAVFGKGGILRLGFRKTGRHIAVFTLEQMCRLFYLKTANVRPTIKWVQIGDKCCLLFLPSFQWFSWLVLSLWVWRGLARPASDWQFGTWPPPVPCSLLWLGLSPSLMLYWRLSHPLCPSSEGSALSLNCSFQLSCEPWLVVWVALNSLCGY